LKLNRVYFTVRYLHMLSLLVT